MSEIDVSKCHFYYKCDYFNCSGYKGVCSDHPECAYKQLQQLKQENEELKEKLEKIKEVINCDEYNKEHCIYCAEAHHCYTKQILEIIESEE